MKISGWLYSGKGSLADFINYPSFWACQIVSCIHIKISHISPSWKINQQRSLYHHSDKFPSPPNLLLIEDPINQSRLKLKTDLSDGELGLIYRGLCECCLVKIWRGPWHCQTTSVILQCPGWWRLLVVQQPTLSDFHQNILSCRVLMKLILLYHTLHYFEWRDQIQKSQSVSQSVSFVWEVSDVICGCVRVLQVIQTNWYLCLGNARHVLL